MEIIGILSEMNLPRVVGIIIFFGGVFLILTLLGIAKMRKHNKNH